MATAVSYKSSAYHSKAGATTTTTPAARDFRDQCEQLHKELERKDQRNDKMIKEMQQVRSSYADLQREMRLTVSTMDKLKAEKKQYEDEANDLRNKNQLLQRKLKTANDPSSLIDQISRDRKDQSFLNENIVNLRGELSLRENKILALQQELVIAHRAVEVQSKYEHMMQPNIANNREIMRTLYFDMGKKQADLHSVTLALAEVTQKLERTEQALRQTTETKDAVFEENEKLKGNVEYLGRQSVENNDEIVHLKGEVERGERLAEHLQARVEDVSAELAHVRGAYTQECSSSQLSIDHFTSEVAILQQSVEALQEKLNTAHAAAATTAEVHATREAQLQEEIARLAQRNAELTDKSQLCRTLQNSADALRAKLADADATREQQSLRVSELLKQLSAKEQDFIKATNSTLALESHLASLNAELSREREEKRQVTSERDEALSALRQTMRATRELSQKYHMEREMREGVERTNEQLLQAKANLSTATLDALYQERRKSAALEKSLALVPLVLKWRSACAPNGEDQVRKREANVRSYSSSSGSVADGGSGEGGPVSVVDEDEAAAIQARRDAIVAAHNISDIARQLDTSAGLHEGVNATFDWLLQDASNAAPTTTAGDKGALPALDITDEGGSQTAQDSSAASEHKDGREGGELQQAMERSDVCTSGSSPAARLTPVKSVPAAAVAAYSPISGAPQSLPMPTPPQERVFFPPSSPTKSPGIAAAMAEAYRHLELPTLLRAQGALPAEVESPGSMMGELRRLRDELRRIEETAPDCSHNDSSVLSAAAPSAENADTSRKVNSMNQTPRVVLAAGTPAEMLSRSSTTNTLPPREALDSSSSVHSFSFTASMNVSAGSR